MPASVLSALNSPLCREGDWGGGARPGLSVGVIGPGRVGQALLDQLREASARLALARGFDLHLRAVVGRQRMWLDCDDPALNGRQHGAQTWRPADLADFVAHVQSHQQPVLLIDCSAHEAIASCYPAWLADGFHVVTPNKLAASGPLSRWRAIQQASALGGHFRYEATVCAGLPVVQTLRDLIETGDQLLAVDGMLSGTLAWLCHRFDGQQPFSALVREAHAQGYTEPDPRDDLSGRDVARKLVILARTAGWSLSLDDVEVESLVPPALQQVSRDECLDRLEELDAPLAAHLARARAKGGVLRHVAHLGTDGQAHVRLQVVPPAHAFAHSRLTDNVVQFQTRRYHATPMVVQGPGAGPEVTAAGIFSDVLRVAEAVGLGRS